MTRAELREAAGFAGLHAALLVAVWLTGALVHSLGAASVSYAWVGVDVALLAGLVVLVQRYWPKLGIRLPWWQVLQCAAIALACVVAAHALIVPDTGVWLDESNYLRTLREGTIVRDGFAPFSMRWLAPFLAGAWNILPVDDAAALEAVNFGAFVVTGTYLALLLVRLGVRLGIAAFAPVFLFCSYLGVYGASHRLVIDPFNYATFVVLFHTLVRREHWRYFPIVLLVAAFNSEKVIYWVPVFALVALLDEPVTWRRVREVAWLTVKYAAPTVLYLVAISLYLRNSQTESGPLFVENLMHMAFTWRGSRIANETVALNNFQVMWFPFGAFTVFTVLSLVYCDKRLKPIVLLLIPIFLQALIAHDTKRMIAYAFIVYLPFGFLYLNRALTALPRVLAIAIFVLMIVVAVLQYYRVPLGFTYWRRIVTLGLAASEVTLTATLIYVHLTWFAQREPHSAAPSS